jgi:transcriptional regulator with XRE-family HTH domain
MDISRRLRDLREAKHLSQGDIEHRTGLLRCYISRVENGHTVPALETLQKLARALETPLYQLFYDGEDPPKIVKSNSGEADWASRGKGSRAFRKFQRALAAMSESDRAVLLSLASEMVRNKRRKAESA